MHQPTHPIRSRTPRRTRRRGSAVMEASLVFFWLIVITFSSIDFGYFFFIKHTLQGAAREGARRAIVAGETNTTVRNVVAESMTAGGFAPGTYTVTIRNADDTADVNVATASPSTGIMVKVVAVWGTVGTRACPVPLISASKNVVGQTVMRKEG